MQIENRRIETHAALDLIVQNYEYDGRTAEKEFKRAIELNPNYATAHHWYAEHLMWRGRFDEAFRESGRARQLDPLSLIIQADNGAILYFSRQYDRAISEFNAVRELDPDFPRARMICSAYVEKGMFAEALAAHKHIRSSHTWDWAQLAYIYGRGGRVPEAQHAMKELLRLNRLQPLDPIVMVQPYL